jgi:hypothetical protein
MASPLELSSFGRTAGNARPTNLARRRARDHQVAFAMAFGHPDRHCAWRPGMRRSSPPASNKKMEKIDDQAFKKMEKIEDQA